MRLIDADVLDSVVMRHNSEGGNITRCDYKRISALLMDFPTIDAVPVRHAYWIRHEDWEEDGYCGWECSECGMGSEVDYKYCMRCGAKMDAERKEE